MNSLVAPLSTRQVTEFHSEVSIVSISAFSLRDVRLCSAVAMTCCLGNAFSHFGFHIFGMGTGMGMETGIASLGVCTSGNAFSKSHIFVNISKSLRVDNEGVLFTRCLVQNLLGNDQPHNQVCQKDAMSSLA